MARGINKTISIGNLCADPETRYMPSGGAVTNVTIAMNETWKDKQTGEKVEKAEFMRVVFFNRLAEVAGEYLKKGSKVYIEGSLRTRKWQDQSGQDKYTTEIVASELQMLDGKPDAQQNNQPAQQEDYRGHPGSNQPNPTYGQPASSAGEYRAASGSTKRSTPPQPSAGDPGFDSFDDDTPF